MGGGLVGWLWWGRADSGSDPVTLPAALRVRLLGEGGGGMGGVYASDREGRVSEGKQHRFACMPVYGFTHVCTAHMLLL